MEVRVTCSRFDDRGAACAIAAPRLRPASPKCLAELEAERVRIANLKGPVSFSSGDAQPCTGATGLQTDSGLLRLAGGKTLASIAFGLQVFMDKRRETMDVLVIESVSMPSEN